MMNWIKVIRLHELREARDCPDDGLVMLLAEPEADGGQCCSAKSRTTSDDRGQERVHLAREVWRRGGRLRNHQEGVQGILGRGRAPPNDCRWVEQAAPLFEARSQSWRTLPLRATLATVHRRLAAMVVRPVAVPALAHNGVIRRACPPEIVVHADRPRVHLRVADRVRAAIRASDHIILASGLSPWAGLVRLGRSRPVDGGQHAHALLGAER
mmetsp:Transcript_88424/g.270652  ORF Transcript_88424/g.270652 Transcript_88424/m.270652 type:complete len:212 (+) Transcript_88424:954-1589(+)